MWYARLSKLRTRMVTCIRVRFSGSGHVLESTSLTVYELEDEEISVHAKDLSGTKPQWSVPKSLFGLVSLLYRRLVISNVSQFADGWVKYNLVTDEKETIYSSARAYFHVGSRPCLSVCLNSCLVNVSLPQGHVFLLMVSLFIQAFPNYLT